MMNVVFTMRDLEAFLNPIGRLGLGKYSIAFPLIGTILFLLTLELVMPLPVVDEGLDSILIIFSSIVLSVYFSFRDGVKGGLFTVGVIVLYYLYIIFARQVGEEQSNSIQAALFLGLVYGILVSIIGWLKQSIDRLIIREKVATQQAEEEKIRLQSVLQELPIAVRIANIKERRIEGNKSMEELLKIKFKNDFDNDLAYMAEHEYRNRKQFQVKDLALYKALSTRRKIVAEEIEYVRDDGKHLNLQISASPVFNKKRQVISVVSTLIDMTSERELDRRKDTFINMASHELKTPITSMNLYLDTLINRVEKLNNNKLAEPLYNVRLQTSRLQDLVSDMLDISRIQTGKFRFEKKEFLLSELISEVCDLFQETRPNIKITVKIAKPLYAFGDRYRIYQVLTNLITNALKYSDRGKEVIVRAKRIKGMNEVSVQDFGIGIAPDQRNKIFSLLYQVNDSKVSTFPGLGMGLFISKEIIKKHKGKIWVESEKGKGSTFFFTLP